MFFPPHPTRGLSVTIDYKFKIIENILPKDQQVYIDVSLNMNCCEIDASTGRDQLKSIQNSPDGIVQMNSLNICKNHANSSSYKVNA